jgi:hypothetical protein
LATGQLHTFSCFRTKSLNSQNALSYCSSTIRANAACQENGLHRRSSAGGILGRNSLGLCNGGSMTCTTCRPVSAFQSTCMAGCFHLYSPAVLTSLILKHDQVTNRTLDQAVSAESEEETCWCDSSIRVVIFTVEGPVNVVL